MAHTHIENPAAGSFVPIPGCGLEAGEHIVVTGHAVEPQTAFAINITHSKDDCTDIAFHFNPRNSEGDVVVRNTFTNGNWGGEERDLPPPPANPFPFKYGEEFSVLIVVHEDRYSVFVNSLWYCSYKHRLTDLSDFKYVGLTEGAVYHSITIGKH